MVSCSLQFFLEAPGRRLPRLVVLQTEQHIVEMSTLLQYPVHGLAAGAAQGHIAVLLPALRVQLQKGQHVDRRLEDIEDAVLARVVEAVLGLLPSTLTLKDLPWLLVLPLVDVVGDAVLVRAHKGPVMVLDILLQQPSPGEASDCLPSDVSPLHKANVNTARRCKAAAGQKA